ncbi:prepilin-type N-terminal cleavage/methylation domain-containing protein [Candidatus Falkowbacteria bacterium]|nr:MAG: prepilin-type N-terminal cleavage/methylation domain-containing protein [Candidatus Falkowbacteria bacterium]
MFFSKFKKKILGFTFLEIMVSVAIVAILASISIIATTRVRIKSRDIKRISNATEIVSALEAYYAANQSYPTMIFPGQPIESNGREYLRAVPSNPSPRTDGGCADSDYTYITTTTGYKLTFCIGSDNSRFAQGVVICKNGNCGIKEDCSGEVEDEEGIRYPIVRIGEQCWMAAHLKSKKRPDGTCINLESDENEDLHIDLTDCVITYDLYPGEFFGGYGGCPSECTLGSRRDCVKINPPILGPGAGLGWLDRGYDTLNSAYDYPPDLTDSACNNRGALYTWAGAMNLDNNCVDTSCAHQVTIPFHRGFAHVIGIFQLIKNFIL